MENETARLAASNRTEDHLETFCRIIRAEESAAHSDIEHISGLDFELHLTIAVASGNLVYPLLINSFKPVYLNFTSVFFSDARVIPETVEFHRRLLSSIEARDPAGAAAVMTEMLARGEQRLKELLCREQQN